MTTANAIISTLGLVAHPEGGYYRETFRSDDRLSAAALPERYDGDRAMATAIYYLIEAGNFSALHRVKSDEVFHFYTGDPVEVFVISPDGEAATTVMGSDIEAAHSPQLLVPKGSIQGLNVARGGAFALLGATVAPGFDFADFELMSREALIKAYPRWSEQIIKLTRG
jgi:predicted cupin superfamily sugar epimerase